MMHDVFGLFKVHIFTWYHQFVRGNQPKIHKIPPICGRVWQLQHAAATILLAIMASQALAMGVAGEAAGASYNVRNARMNIPETAGARISPPCTSATRRPHRQLWSGH